MSYLIFTGLTLIGTIAFIIGIPLCIFFAVKAHGELDANKKKRLKRKAMWSILGPILLVFLSIMAQGFATVFRTAF
ncbi:MAG: hypothetical protein AAB417_02025 [Patescibacteria group bacterium]